MSNMSKFAVIAWGILSVIVHLRYDNLTVTIVFSLLPIIMLGAWMYQNVRDGLPIDYNLE